jgi:hypothetical protein
MDVIECEAVPFYTARAIELFPILEMTPNPNIRWSDIGPMCQWIDPAIVVDAEPVRKKLDLVASAKP